MVVTLLAEGVFGYTFGSHKGDDRDIPSAKALGNAMAATICIPWCFCFLAYTLLHWTYPRDVRRLEAQEQQCVASQDSSDKLVDVVVVGDDDVEANLGNDEKPG